MLRNWIATLVLAFGVQQIAWTILDFEGLRRADYALAHWPYELNPRDGGVLAGFAVLAAILIYEKRWSISGLIGIMAAVAAGVRFWVLRRPAEPYTDYGEDNTVTMILHEFIVGVFMLVVCGIDFAVRHTQGQSAQADQGVGVGEGDRD